MFDTSRTTHHYLAGTTDTRRRSIDVQTGYLTVQRINKVSIFHSQSRFSVYLSYVVAQCLFCSFNTQGSNHHFINQLRVCSQFHSQRSVTLYGNFLRGVADVRNLKHRIGFGSNQGKVTVHIGNGTYSSTLYQYVYTNQRTHIIGYSTDNGAFLTLLRAVLGSLALF